MLTFDALFADIFIVDTDRDFIRSIRSVLQAAGYAVRSATPTAALLPEVADRPPDLILLAMTPSTTSDAQHMIRRLKNETRLPFIPIIATAHAPTQAEVAAILNAGADEFIAKPVHNAELLTRVKAMLRLKKTTDQLADLNTTLEQKVMARTAQLEEAQARLRHAEKLSALGRLAASVAHEINNPLSSILLHLYLVEKAEPADPDLRASMGIIEGQIEAIARLVEQLRNFSKPPRQEYQRVNLNHVLEDVLALTGKELEQQKIDVVREFDGALTPVSAARDQMSEVFMNLIVNAQDAMPDGGTLTLRTQAREDTVRVQVCDTGVGIAPEIADRIFEPFFTTKGEEGTGLGLSICHSIVQEHGGDIHVASDVGRGTTFHIRLPGAEEGPERSTAR
jgi:signal transduction histidine kinase